MPKMVGEGSAREREEKVVMARSKKGKGWILGIARLNHMTKSLLHVRLFHCFGSIEFPMSLKHKQLFIVTLFNANTELFLNMSRHPSVSLSWHPEALSKRAVVSFIALLYST